jgi:hypothetical protein
MPAPRDLTDAQWAVLDRLIPEQRRLELRPLFAPTMRPTSE